MPTFFCNALYTLLAPRPPSLATRFWALIYLPWSARDILLNFNTGFRNHTTMAWVIERQLIAHKYLRSWFTVDLLSSVPWDIFADPAAYFQPNSKTENEDGLQGLQLLRLMKLLRCLKLLRVLRASQVITRWRSRLPISNGTQTILK